MNVDKLPIIYIIDQEKQEVVRYEHDQVVRCPMNIGIIGEVIRTKKMLYLTEPY